MIAGFCHGQVPEPDWRAIGQALSGMQSRMVNWRSGKVARLASLQPSAYSAKSFSAASSQCQSVFYGWLDNRADLQNALGLGDAPDDVIYAAALQRWGNSTDHHVIGSYCAITALPDGRLRLVRSPWSAPPLHFIDTDKRTCASSVLRVLFAAGHPREVDYDHVTDQLLQDHHDGESRGWYCGVGRVPLGTCILLGPGTIDERRYYDPCAIPALHFANDEDYLAAAQALIDEAATVALAGCERPGLMLSGGLDSAIVAEALLRKLPEERRLPSFTFGPEAAWDGTAPPYRYGDEREFVRAFAAKHPRLEPHFPDSLGHDFDYRLRELFAACDTPTANVANVGIMHGVWQAAKSAGCDCLLNAELGNFTISNEAPWYSVEYFLRGRWGALRRALDTRPGDSRPLWRKFLALSILPLVPAPVRQAIRLLVNPQTGDLVPLLSMLNLAAKRDHLKRRKSAPLMYAHRPPKSRKEWIMRAWHSADSGEDLDLGFERLYGMRRRDVSAYRPLIEFCMGLPTAQFVGQGLNRRLARRLAEGHMPEAQRLNPLYGAHHPDWHVRLGRRRNELTEYAERMRSHPFLGQAVDIDRMQRLLKDWPEITPHDHAEALPRSFALTRALTAAAFIGYAEGRNEL